MIKMNKNDQKPVVFGEVRGCINVVGNVVIKNIPKKHKKTSKIGKVRVRSELIELIDLIISNFKLKSERFFKNSKREGYNNVIFSKKVSYGGMKDQKY